MDVDGDPVAACVGISHVEAGRQMAREIAARGYRRIGYCGSSSIKDHRAQKRRQGFEQGLAEAGLSLADACLYAGTSGFGTGRGMTAEILGRTPDLDFLYYNSDINAAGGLLYCLEKGMDIPGQIGSHRWCLRRWTVEWSREFVAERPDVVRFFRTTWIPDETFFQTLVRHLVPETEIRSRTLTFLMFSDYGMPVNFYNDHYDLLLSQDFLFARKISPDAHELKERLGTLYSAKGVEFKISNEGRGLYSFLTERGRIGRRFGMRFWETETTLGRERELLIVISKKWHVAKRLLAFVRQKTNIPAIEYMFNEEDTALPDLGGIQNTLAKRTRHRRALMRMLFDYFSTDRMIICIDPANIELLKDLTGDRSVTRLMEVECEMTDDYLIGHAKRIGLAGEHTSDETWERLLPTIRSDIVFESDRIRDAGFQNYTRVRQQAEPSQNALALAEFLSISEDLAQEITSIEYLFED
jgi:hypothetical protein